MLGPMGLHYYIRLWGVAEDWGGYKPNYEDLSLQMGALKILPKKCEEFDRKLIESGHIIRYQINGQPIHWLKNLMDHQPLNNPTPPKLPLPEWMDVEIHEYKSGKKYAKYRIIRDKLPDEYQDSTGRLLVTLETETVTETETERNYKVEVQEVLDFLNSRVGKNYQRREEIEARLRDGGSVEDCKKIILTKLKDPYFQKNLGYYHPTTLFRKSHWDKYLSESPGDYSEEEEDGHTAFLRSHEKIG
jgi:uncharacterized phage protein (TIGR02220 family)